MLGWSREAAALPTRPSEMTGRSKCVRRASTFDRESRRHDRVHVFLTATGVVDPVVADLGRVARGDLVDAELGPAHRAELAAEALHQDLGALAGIAGGRGERVELRLRQLV